MKGKILLKKLMVFMLIGLITFATVSESLYANTQDSNELINVSNEVEDNVVSPAMIIGGNNGIVTSDTVRYSVSNSNKERVVNLLGAHIATKLPVKLAQSTIANFLLTEAFGTINYETAYIESWNWKVREGSNCYRHYATVNNYSDSSYTNLIKTSQLPASLECS